MGDKKNSTLSIVYIQIRDLNYPFRGFHFCHDGNDGSKVISCMMSHPKTLHICGDERKNAIWNAIENDQDLFTVFKEYLRVFKQLLCERSMIIHAMSRE